MHILNITHSVIQLCQLSGCCWLNLRHCRLILMCCVQCVVKVLNIGWCSAWCYHCQFAEYIHHGNSWSTPVSKPNQAHGSMHFAMLLVIMHLQSLHSLVLLSDGVPTSSQDCRHSSSDNSLQCRCKLVAILVEATVGCLPRMAFGHFT